MSAAVFGMLLFVSAHATPAAGADCADALSAGPLCRDFGGARDGASVTPQWTANLLESLLGIDEAAHVSFDSEAGKPAGPTRSAPTHVGGQARPLAASYRPNAGPGSGTSVDMSLSDLVARLHYAFGKDIGVSGDGSRQAERQVLLRNSDALVRAKVPLTLGKEWLGFVYADMGATDSALRWQSLAGIRGGHGVELLGGWRHVTYHFSPGRGLDSLDFNGPFLGATLAY